MKTNLLSHSLKHLTKTYLGQVTVSGCYIIRWQFRLKKFAAAAAVCVSSFSFNFFFLLWLHVVLFCRYDIQSGIHDPYEDCISVMRLYKRMCGQDHRVERFGDKKANIGFDSFKSTELDKMIPEELYEISESDYKCWCLDLSKDCSPGSWLSSTFYELKIFIPGWAFKKCLQFLCPLLWE